MHHWRGRSSFCTGFCTLHYSQIMFAFLSLAGANERLCAPCWVTFNCTKYSYLGGDNCENLDGIWLATGTIWSLKKSVWSISQRIHAISSHETYKSSLSYSPLITPCVCIETPQPGQGHPQASEACDIVTILANQRPAEAVISQWEDFLVHAFISSSM